MIGGLKQTTSRLAIAAAAGLFTGGIALTPVQAASLGGDCCADLEERVAELEATTVRKGNRKVSVTLRGHVNNGVMYWDDGEESDKYVGMSSASATRIYIEGNAQISEGRLAFYRIQFRPTILARFGSMSQTSSTAGGGIGNLLQNSYLGVKDDTLGQILIGYGGGPRDGTMGLSFAGVSVVMEEDGADSGGGFGYRTSGGTISAITVGSTFTSYDGGSAVAIRYDTPTFAGFSVAVAFALDDYAEYAVRYKKEFNSVLCAAAFGSTHFTHEITYDYWIHGGSVACIHSPSGLNFAYSHGWEDFETVDKDHDGEYNRIQVGISRRWNAHGKTNIAAQYIWNDDVVSLGDESDSWGVAIVQNIDSAALELYLDYRTMDYSDTSSTTYQDPHFITSGMRIKF